MGRAHPHSFLCLGQLGCRGQILLAVLFSAAERELCDSNTVQLYPLWASRIFSALHTWQEVWTAYPQHQSSSFSLWPSTFQRTAGSKSRNRSVCLAFQISMIPVGMQERVSLTFSFKNNILAKSLPRCLNSGTCGMFWPVNEVLSQCLLRVSNTWLTPYRGHLFLKILSWFL